MKCFLAGLLNLQPPPHVKPRDTWDVNKVLDYWKKQPENKKLDLLELAKKTVIVTLLSTMWRKNELLSLTLDQVYYFLNRVVFLLAELSKTQATGTTEAL